MPVPMQSTSSPSRHTSPGGHSPPSGHTSPSRHPVEEGPEHSGKSQAKKRKKNVLINFTDNKVDDKIGITASERLNKYKDVHIIYSGIKDTRGAHVDQADWHHSMDNRNAKTGNKFHKANRTFYSGGTPFTRKNADGKEEAIAMPHEKLFVKQRDKRPPPPPLHDFNDIDKHFEKYQNKKRKADIFMSGPTVSSSIISGQGLVLTLSSQTY
jgi:hypothetical protein